MLKRLTVVLFFLISLNVYGHLTGYSYYKDINTNNGEVIGAGSHNDFPVLVSYQNGDLKSVGNGGNVQSVNGYDIQFTLPDGNTLLDHQIEFYDPTSGEIVFWVRLPTISTTLDTYFRIYYGNAAVVTDQSVNTVWDANYKGVFHLNSLLVDGSTINDDFDSNLGVTATPSKIANGADFNPVNPDYLGTNINSEHQILGDLTLESWVSIDNLITNGFDNIIVACATLGNTSADNIPYYFYINNNGTLGMYWEYINGGTPNQSLSVESTVSAGLGGGWKHVAVTRNTTTKEFYFYKNGVQLGAPVPYSDNPSGGSATNLVLGNHPAQTAFKSDFTLDEVRLSNMVRSPDWLETSFNSMDNTGAFLDFSGENCVGPSVTSCVNNITVTADASCLYNLGDYTGDPSFVVIDHCGSGITKTQLPAAGPIGAGVHEIKLYAEDGGGLVDSCSFFVTVQEISMPDLINCGDEFIGETTNGAGNDVSNFSCVGYPTNGEEKFYQITVPGGNYWIQVSMDNLSDDSNTYADVFFLDATCPIGSTCLGSGYMNKNTDLFQNGTNTLKFLATGPGTYFIAVDCDNGDLDSYDLRMDCLESGIELDEGCAGDSNSDGVLTTVDLGPSLILEACENYKICNNVRVSNPVDQEWLDSVKISLGDCYTNITNLTPDNLTTNFYNSNGDWDGTYLAGDNSIVWKFNDPVNNYGDGYNTGPSYSCGQGNGMDYDFCFNADITPGCLGTTDLEIKINIIDDAVGGGGGTVASIDAVVIDNMTLNVPDGSFSYDANIYCVGTVNKTPTIAEPGGTFSVLPLGLSIDPSTGVIDFSLSTPNDYVITYSTNNTCPVTETFNLSFNALPTFTAGSETDPTTCSGADGTITISGLIDGTAYDLNYSNGSAQIVSNLNSTLGSFILGSLPSDVYDTFSIKNITTGCISAPIATSITLTDPLAPSINAGVDIIICDNIDTMLTAVNPNGASLAWDNAITNATLFSPSLGTTTYEVTATLLGCVSTDQVDVTVNPLPNINAGVDITICDNIDTMLTAINPDGAALSWDNGITNATLFSPPVGTTSYVVTATLLGCVSTDTADVTVNIIPSINAGVDITICDNIDTMLTANNPDGAALSWDNGITDATLFTPTIGTTTYEVTATLLGCVSTDVADLTVNIIPTVNAGVDITICDNIDTMFTATNPNGAALSWDNGITDATLFTPSIGTTTYEVTATLLGCVSTDVADLTVNIIPTVNAGVDITICDNIDTMFTATNPDGASLSWDNGITDAILFTPAIGTTTYEVTATLLGCVSTDDADVTVNIIPTVNAGVDITICDNIDTMFTAANPNGAALSWDNGITDATLFIPSIGTTTYEVTATLLGCASTDFADLTVNIIPSINAGVDISICNNIDTMLTAINPDGALISWDNGITDATLFSPPLGTTTYEVTATLLGCVSTDVVDVSANPLPHVDAGVDIIICENVDTMFTADNPDGAAITWDNGVTDATLFTPSVGTLTYIVTASLLGCVTTDDADLTVNPLPNINAGVDITICENVDTVLTAINPDGASVSWDNGITNATLFSPSVGTTTYEVTATLLGCISTDDADVVVNPLPIINAGVDITICENIDTMLTAINPNGASLSWDNGITDATLFMPTLGTTTYEITATLLGCVSTDVADVTVNLIPSVDAGLDFSICEFEDTMLTAINPDGASISWDNGIIDATLFIPNTGTTTYEVTATLLGCVSTDAVDIFSQVLEDVGFSYSQDDFCTNEGQVSPLVNVLGGAFSINNNFAIESNLGTIDLTDGIQGQYEINYFKDDALCPVDSTVIINIYEIVFADAGIDQILEYTFESELVGNDISYGTGIWTVINGISEVDDPEYNITNVSQLNYGDNIYTWTVENGVCPIRVDTIIIHVEELLIPQAVTPNADGKNDVFLIKGIENKENKVQVFNRWGELVFASINNDGYWEGTDTNSKELPNDTYFYIVEIIGEPTVYKGFVMLKK